MSATKQAFEKMEEVADLCHKQWSAWMRLFLAQCPENEDGTFTISKSLYDKCWKQIRTKYENMSPEDMAHYREAATMFAGVFTDDQKENSK